MRQKRKIKIHKKLILSIAISTALQADPETTKLNIDTRQTAENTREAQLTAEPEKADIIASEQKFWKDINGAMCDNDTCVNYTEHFDEALERSEEEHKPIIVFAKIPGCPKCGYMEDVALKEKAIVKIINTYFIAIKLEKGSEFLTGTINPDVYPSFFIIDCKKQIVGDTQYGMTNKKAFERYLNRIVDNIKNGKKPVTKEDLEKAFSGVVELKN